MMIIMTKSKYSDRRDKNELEIVKEFERLGYHVIRMGRTAGFDLLVIGKGKVFIIEVKNPEGFHFTKAEEDLQLECESRGVAYHIVMFVNQIAEVVS